MRYRYVIISEEGEFRSKWFEGQSCLFTSDLNGDGYCLDIQSIEIKPTPEGLEIIIPQGGKTLQVKENVQLPYGANNRGTLS